MSNSYCLPGNGVLTQFGALDVLVNTVGGYVGGVKLWETTTEVFDQMLALNLRSGYVLAHAALPSAGRRCGRAGQEQQKSSSLPFASVDL